MALRLTAARHPFIYEIHAWAWLSELRRRTGRQVGLADVPDRDWDQIAELGFDAVWLMGVWERSPASVAIGLHEPDLVDGYRQALPDLGEADATGSPYSVRRYVVDDHLGGPRGLAAARRALADRGLGLLLDFVPNHVATDHPWTSSDPGYFVGGSPADLERDPSSFVEVDGRVLANGRDPYFPAWTDVVQVDAFSPGLRAAAIDTLTAIAEQCDGVRCDMAMLMLDDVFARTWGDRVGDPLDVDYWLQVIPAVHARHPGFMFIAEAYWDLESTLHDRGFDYCYDKRLYDRLVHGSADAVREHLRADPAYQDKLVRFVENHDEPRAATIAPPARAQAATVAALTQTGARLVHHGQLTGARVHLPVALGRAPDEPVDADVAAFHRSLLDALSDETFREGQWALCELTGWPDNDTWRNLIAWCWDGPSRWLVVVNLSDVTSAGHVTTPWGDLRGQSLRLTDPTDGSAFDRDGGELVDGMFVQLDPWRWHLLRVASVG